VAAVAEPLIACEGVAYTYRRGTPMEAPALRGVSLEIAAGQVVALLGPTGSGKSTLVQHFNGLLRPAAGTVRVAGQDLWGLRADRRRARQQVGLVFQFPEHQLFEETVRRDVAYGPTRLGLSEAVVAERVDEALRAVGLDPTRFGDRPPFALSGGEVRRVALAGVLAMQPRVLVLDEPTAGLDPGGKAEMLTRLQALHRDGQTIVFITHDMDEAARLAERVVVLDNGRIVMDGSPAEIFGRDDLGRHGLDLPQATRLVRALRARGLLVADAVTMHEARAAIRAALRARA
jgi:energy-coupling factor transport system ATP-binding protein